MFSALLFDIGNVILPFDLGPALQRLRARSKVGDPAAWQKFDALKIAYESGQVDRAGFLAAVRHHVGFAGGETDFAAIWTDIFQPNPAMDAFIEEQAVAGRPMFLLSNTNDLHVEHFTRVYPIFGRFRGAVYSHEEKLFKPDPAIFRVAIDRFGLVPAETLYLDDLAPNIAAARALGFQTLLYDWRRHEDSMKGLPAGS